MKRNKTFLFTLIAFLAGVMAGYAQHNNTFQNKIEPAKDSISYPNVNTPNHNAIPPGIHGTFDDPKIIPDSTTTKKDNRGRENPDSVLMQLWKKNQNDGLKKDTMQ